MAGRAPQEIEKVQREMEVFGVFAGNSWHSDAARLLISMSSEFQLTHDSLVFEIPPDPQSPNFPEFIKIHIGLSLRARGLPYLGISKGNKSGPHGEWLEEGMNFNGWLKNVTLTDEGAAFITEKGLEVLVKRGVINIREFPGKPNPNR